MMLLAALAALAAQALAPPPADVRAAITRHFDTVLFDGPSARWRWPARQPRSLYCGWVNAKNRMGAYTGWQIFLVSIDGTTITEGRIESSTYRFPRDLCEMMGFDVTAPPSE